METVPSKQHGPAASAAPDLPPDGVSPRQFFINVEKLGDLKAAYQSADWNVALLWQHLSKAEQDNLPAFFEACKQAAGRRRDERDITAFREGLSAQLRGTPKRPPRPRRSTNPAPRKRSLSLEDLL